jgi:hypothetical protein
MKFMKDPRSKPREKYITKAVRNPMSSFLPTIREFHLNPILSAMLCFSRVPTAPGCQRSRRSGSRIIVKKKAKKTPSPDMNAKTFIGSRFEVAKTDTPAAVVNVVSKIAQPTFS